MAEMPMAGLFITIEGVEGAGKSTQARLLADALRARGRDVLATREPGGTEISQRIREILLAPAHGAMDPMTELLLYAAARRQHVTEVILPALKAGRTVISDRFSDSTLAYQGHGRGLSLETITSLNLIATGGLAPGLTIVLDVPPEAGLARNRHARKNDRLELEDLAFHRRVHAGFREIARAEPERIRLIPSIKDVQATHEAVIEAVLRYMDAY